MREPNMTWASKSDNFIAQSADLSPRGKNSAFVMEYRAGFNPTLNNGIRLENPRVSLVS